MGWPIMLRRVQSDAALGAARDFSKTLTGESKALYGILVYQMEHGVTLGLEEQEMLRCALLWGCREGTWGRDAEDAYFRLYGVWPVRPTWYEKERQEKANPGLT